MNVKSEKAKKKNNRDGSRVSGDGHFHDVI